MNLARRELRIWRLGLPLTRIALLILLGSSLASFSGCQLTSRSVQNLRKKGYPEKAFEGYRDFVWAQRAYNLRYGNCNVANESDFRAGFIEGYCDTCDGGTGKPPAVPPSEYWGSKYQDEQGKQSISAWFKGFPEGVRAAKQDGSDKSKRIFISNEMKAALDLTERQSSAIIRADQAVPSLAAPRSQVRDQKPLSWMPPKSPERITRVASQPTDMGQATQSVMLQEEPLQKADVAPPSPVGKPVENVTGIPQVIPGWEFPTPQRAKSNHSPLPVIVQPGQSTNDSMFQPMPRNLVPIVSPQDLPQGPLDKSSSHQDLPQGEPESNTLFPVVPVSWEQEEKAGKK